MSTQVLNPVRNCTNAEPQFLHEEIFYNMNFISHPRTSNEENLEKIVRAVIYLFFIIRKVSLFLLFTLILVRSKFY